MTATMHWQWRRDYNGILYLTTFEYPLLLLCDSGYYLVPVVHREGLVGYGILETSEGYNTIVAVYWHEPDHHVSGCDWDWVDEEFQQADADVLGVDPEDVLQDGLDYIKSII